MNTSKKQFKLVGVRPLKGCAPHIRKILKENETYLFYNDYKVDDNNPEIVIHKGSNQLTTNFFTVSSGFNSPCISISAIVGKKGDGKSTIVELIMRILNNLAFAAGYQYYQTTLKSISGLRAILYFSIDDKVHYFKVDKHLVKSDLLNEILNIREPLNRPDILFTLQDFLFYTQITNFSLYAYNSNEFIHENKSSDGCWINGIFHKNDAYQTPIVLTPFREEGNSNINTENDLMLQRLISLFVDSDDSEDSFKKIDNKKEAHYLILNEYTDSKLDSITYREHFIDTYKANDNFSNQILDINEYKKNSQRLSDEFKRNHINKLKNIKSIIEENKSDFDYAMKILASVKRKLRPKNSDFKIYINQLKDLLRNNDDADKNNFLDLIKFLTKYNNLNLLQLQRIITVITIRKLWQKEIPEYFSQVSVYGNDYTAKAQQYILYKTISIITKYPQFKKIDNINTQDNFNSLFFYESNYRDIEITHLPSFNELLNDIKEKKSHVTLKVRQTINFLVYNQKPNLQYIKTSDNKYSKINKLVISKKIKTDNLLLIKLSDYKQRILNLKSNHKGSVEKEIIEFLPPPIFKTNIIFMHFDPEEFSLLSDFSSGERQLLNNISSVIYHLRNLNSVSNEGLIKYQFVNLIFEEIELYFHPEYQKHYINRLLTNIQKEKLHSIQSINICFITHSPFILSDIPNCNILRIKNGKPDPTNEKTFGANIHDLLANDFFLYKGFMGEFAKSKINQVIDDLRYIILNNELIKEKSKEKSDPNKILKIENDLSDLEFKTLSQPECERIINQIGEPVLKQSLLELYAQAFPQGKRAFLQKQINYLTDLMMN